MSSCWTCRDLLLQQRLLVQQLDEATARLAPGPGFWAALAHVAQLRERAAAARQALADHQQEAHGARGATGGG